MHERHGATRIIDRQNELSEAEYFPGAFILHFTISMIRSVDAYIFLRARTSERQGEGKKKKSKDVTSRGDECNVARFVVTAEQKEKRYTALGGKLSDPPGDWPRRGGSGNGTVIWPRCRPVSQRAARRNNASCIVHDCEARNPDASALTRVRPGKSW